MAVPRWSRPSFPQLLSPTRALPKLLSYEVFPHMKLTPFQQPITSLLLLSRHISTTTTPYFPKQQSPPQSPIQPNTMDLPSPPPAEEQPPSYITAARSHGIPLRQSAPLKPNGGGGPPLPLQLPILNHLRTKRVILASASPRRRAMLHQIGLPSIEVWPSNSPENLDKKSHSPEEYVSATARAKCHAVYEAVLTAQSKADASKEQQEDPAVVIAADTIIATRAGQILEKPRSEQEHIKMLTHLRDSRYHRVLTAVCVMAPKADASHPGYEIRGHVEDTKVFFAREEDGLPDDVIEGYVKTREGADKAGGYALQGVGGMVLVEKVEGGVDNVVGLPVRKCLQLCERVVFRQGEEEVEEEEDE